MNKTREKTEKNHRYCSLNDDSIRFMEKIWYRLYTNRWLRRCSKCILPETAPFIDFDKKGVCNYCRTYKKVKIKGAEELENIVAPYRSKSKEPDCLISFSGGRDSSYGLYYVKNVLKMNPLAYTYDWGMATNVALRNQEKMCRALDIKRIIIPAYTEMKQRNIKKNIEAWLKKPNLGMVPLFMAGDKQVIYYARKLKQQTGLKLMFHCIGNQYEDAVFKMGFSNVCVESPMVFCNIPLRSKIKIATYYAKQYLLNTAYINSSLIDTLHGYFSLFFLKGEDSDILLFHFIKWDEQEILSKLINDYGWEHPLDTKLTWRIDDATSAFYNYIYLAVAGFTENDTFRSAQIREGCMTREQALGIVREENKPRCQVIEWYASKIGFDCNKAVKIINAMPKLYKC
ncbi:MAG: hypothetical protein V1699_00300 [Candidatus Omnitrophota bacterium]